jgi:hypothetical protein
MRTGMDIFRNIVHNIFHERREAQPRPSFVSVSFFLTFRHEPS